VELLVRVVDKDGSSLLGKRGDVIVCCPDGWAWSPAELTNPDWRILSVPNLPQAEADSLTAPEAGDRAVNVMRKRGMSLDLDGLPAGTKARLDAVRSGHVTLPLAALRAARKVKAQLRRDDVLGPRENVLGPREGG
jgi:hypothetical protein